MDAMSPLRSIRTEIRLFSSDVGLTVSDGDVGDGVTAGETWKTPKPIDGTRARNTIFVSVPFAPITCAGTTSPLLASTTFTAVAGPPSFTDASTGSLRAIDTGL